MILKLFGKKAQEQDDVQAVPLTEEQQMRDDFEAVKTQPGQITGCDFGRAFDFIENYPKSEYAELLLNQMYSTSSESLKGLTYESAVKVLEIMPDHAGADSIVRGMYKLEADYIAELSSTVIAYILDVIPDHPLGKELTTALVEKNIGAAYDFIQTHPNNVYTDTVIQAMFTVNANLALLLLQEKLDHPKVDVIFAGIYAIEDEKEMDTFTSNAIIFLFEVAPDHPKIEYLVRVFVQNNYIKAYDFAKNNPDFPAIDLLFDLIYQKLPTLRDIPVDA